MSEAALAVLYRDDVCAVVDKPAGLMAHASGLSRGEDDFLLHRLREQFDSRVHLIHRLDRATSGCVLVAFDSGTAAALSKSLEFKATQAQQAYLGYLDAALKNAPAGSESAVALFKQAMSVSNNAVESVQKAVKQVTQVAESNLQAVTDTAVKAAKTAASKKR